MNLSILGRVIWKEYRLQRPLWLVMVALVIIADLLTLWCDPSLFYKVVILHYIALITPALYMLGCGAMLFAGEHEVETYEFQRSLPVHAMQILVGKVAVVAGSAVMMLGLTMLLADRLAPLPPIPQGASVNWRLLAWATVGFFAVEMFVWAVLFSLLTKRVLMAAILGVSAASIGAHLVGAAVAWDLATGTYVQALYRRITIVAVVALVDVWLAARWLREKRRGRSRDAQALPAETPPQTTAIGDRFIGPQRLSILGRLLWQHWRQSRRVFLVISLLLVPLVAVLITWIVRASDYPAWFLRRHSGDLFPPTEQSVFLSTLLLTLAAVPLFGVGAFLVDQRKNSRRFLTDHGVSPGFVWLSRELITLGVPMLVFVSILLGLFLLVSALMPIPEHVDAGWQNLSLFYAGTYCLVYLVLSVLGYVLIGIAVGQFCSMFIHSPLLAGLVSVLLTGVLVAWSGLMLYWRVNWFWSILPIPLALLLATRLHAADWLVERRGLRTWLRPSLALLIPAAALLVAVPLYRVYSLPMVNPGFLPEEFAQPLTPGEQESLGLYEQAFTPFVIWPPQDRATLRGEQRNEKPSDKAALEAAWADAESRQIALALKASRKKIHHCPAGASLPAEKKLSDLAQLLIRSAVASEKAGRLDAALDRYLAAVQLASYIRDWYPIPITSRERLAALATGDAPIETAVYGHLPRWATRKGQTPGRIIAAVRRLEKLTTETPSTNGVKLAYLQLRRFLAGDASVIRNVDDRNVPGPFMLWMRLPSERARAERLLNLLTSSQLDALSRVEEDVRRSKPFNPPPCGPNVVDYLLRQTDSPSALLTQISIPPVEYDANWGEVQLVQDYMARVAAQRAVRIVLALEAWKLKHGSLPKKLDELVGHGLDRLPVDPYSGTPFRYFPDGLKTPLHWSQPRLLTAIAPSTMFAYDQGTVAPNTPFLWAAGAKLLCGNTNGTRSLVDGDNALAQYQIFARIRDSMDEWRRPDSEFDVWESGWPFPIPHSP